MPTMISLQLPGLRYLDPLGMLIHAICAYLTGQSPLAVDHYPRHESRLTASETLTGPVEKAAAPLTPWAPLAHAANGLTIPLRGD